MYTGLLHTHRLVVILFLLLYLVKLVLLLLNQKENLAKVTKITKIPEMVISTLFLLTGIIMLFQVAEITPLLLAKIGLVLASIPIAIIGFKRSNKILATLSVLLIVSAYGLAEMNKVGVNNDALATTVISDPTADGYDNIAHGLALYQRNCIVCHGADGKSKKSGSKDLSISKLNEGEIESLIKKGKNAMPAYSALYSESEVAAVISYIQTLRE